MGAEVSLVGIRGTNPEYAYPRVAEVCEELGFKGLADSLKSCPVALLERVDADLGFCQFRVRDPRLFVDHVRKNPGLWDSVGFGFDDAIRLLEQFPDLTWWFHVAS